MMPACNYTRYPLTGCAPPPRHYQPTQCKCHGHLYCACYQGGFPLCTGGGWECN